MEALNGKIPIGGGVYSPNRVSVEDPNRERRDYELSGQSPLVGLIDNPWYPPYVPDRIHYHNCLEIGVCLSGEGTVELGRGLWQFRAGSIVAAGRGLRHCQQNAGRPMTHWQYVLVDEDVLVQETPSRHRTAIRTMLEAARSRGMYFDADEECRDLRFVLQSMFDLGHRRQESARMELEAMTALLAAIMSRSLESAMSDLSPDVDARRPIEPALRYVSENYMRQLRVEELAASCAMSVSYFRKVFGRIMGTAPLEYVNRYRVNRALNLLRGTDETVLQIAVQTGFPSVATFNRNFRRYVGKSPADWRKNAHI